MFCQKIVEAVAIDFETLEDRNLSHLFEWVNGSLRLINGTSSQDELIQSIIANATSYAGDRMPPDEYINSMPSLKAFFYCLYVLIFVIGITGNTLVCYVVIRNKNMQTVTNLFICNLALSDILLCMFAVPFTPLYLLTFRVWVSDNSIS